jgi:predicted nucleic-acid-binding Zn-ribbon protein
MSIRFITNVQLLKEVIESIMNQFDNVWIGKYCKSCKRKEFYGDPIL